LRKKHIAVTDAVEKCIRINGNSSDKNLDKIEFRNIYKLLKNNSATRKVVLIHKKLSKSRNNSALELFNEYLRSYGINIQELHKESTGLIQGKFILNNKNICPIHSGCKVV
jgi:hypothetical protein